MLKLFVDSKQDFGLKNQLQRSRVNEAAAEYSQRKVKVFLFGKQLHNVNNMKRKIFVLVCPNQCL